MTLPAGFAAVIVGEREDVHDALVSNRFAGIGELPLGAVVGTSSLRRESQLRTLRPDLKIEALRGNVNTRLAKLDAGQYDAIILAAAGLKRLGLAERIRQVVPIAHSLPAPGQGALGIEILAGRPDLRRWLAPLADARTWLEVTAERAVSRALGGSCRIPLAAYCARQPDGTLRLDALLATGPIVRRASVSSAVADTAAAERLGEQAAAMLR